MISADDPTQDIDWTGGLPAAFDFMLPQRPADPEMRESASVWLFEENGDFALPRVGIEAQGAVWDAHRFDMNVAFPDGRVLRESARAPTHAAQATDGVARILGAGGLTFTCVEPFQKWRASYEGEAWDGAVTEQIAGTFGVYADGNRDQGLDGRRRVPVSSQFDLTMAAPAWVQDYRPEKLAGMSERERADAGSMGYGWRVEQLLRGEGAITIDGDTRLAKVAGSRIHRQSVRPMGAFRGHCWQSAIFPDGRGFGYIAYPPAAGLPADDTYNNAYVVVDGCLHPAKAVKIPFLRNIMPCGDDVSLELEWAGGTWKIAAATHNATFHMGNPGVNGFNNQQSGVRYAFDGMTAYGMIERSSPSDVCVVRR